MKGGLQRSAESTGPAAREYGEIQNASPFPDVRSILVAFAIPDPNHLDYRPKRETQALMVLYPGPQRPCLGSRMYQWPVSMLSFTPLLSGSKANTRAGMREHSSQVQYLRSAKS